MCPCIIGLHYDFLKHPVLLVEKSLSAEGIFVGVC